MTQSSIDIAGDLPKGTVLLTELTNSAKNVCNSFQDLSKRFKDGDLQTEMGLSLLELKNQIFLSYLANLSFTTLLKLSGLPLNGNPSIEHLVEQRVVLERMRPLEEKLKHQIEKYIKMGSTGGTKDQQPSDVKNSLDNIEDSSDEEAEQNVDKDEENQLYKIPRISQMHYPGEEDKDDNRQKRERMRALKSSMLRDALQEHTDDPEVFYNMDTLKHKAIEKRKQIQRYEEDNFTRLTLSKKEKASMKQMTTPGTLGQDLLSFRSLEGFEGHSETGAGGQKRKRSSKSKKTKGFKKRKKR